MIVGAILSTWIALTFHNLPLVILMPLIFLGGLLGGMVWSLIAGLLLVLGVPLNRVLKRIRAIREERYGLFRGFFRGATDAADTDCAPVGETACDDGVDNDGDGKIDFRTDGTGDPGCTGPEETSEKGTGVCDDGLDNDGDGWIDLLDADCGTEYDEDGLDEDVGDTPVSAAATPEPYKWPNSFPCSILFRSSSYYSPSQSPSTSPIGSC